MSKYTSNRYHEFDKESFNQTSKIMPIPTLVFYSVTSVGILPILWWLTTDGRNLKEKIYNIRKKYK